MRFVTAFPHRVREIEHCWIPLADGCRLAARIWLPEDAEIRPVPAIVEYLPYRKRDFTRARDEPMHRYFAGHGYAALRVDLRGSGESDGLLLDEYLQQEHDDGVEAIRWIAAQPWCSGVVGMIGKSWGGFNALQIAARRPPELKAIISVCASDDRYADDAHYMGGCLLNENLIWGSVLLTFAAQPPDPALVGEAWREIWHHRLRNLLLFPEIWLRHQRRDDYWRHGSVREDYARIACPVYAVGGWADGYTNGVLRLLAGIEVPHKGLIGPWAHVYPHDGVPPPAIGFLQEALRWWDHWLKGIDTGIMEEPAYRVWMQERVPPTPFHEPRPGRWVGEERWPSPNLVTRRYALNDERLNPRPGPEIRLQVHSPQTVGFNGGDWCGFGVRGEMPTDQREDDGKSLCFDSEPLAERLEILGAPVVTLELAADRPHGFVVVRLNDVAPDGASSRVSFGVLNLTHRHGHERPEPLGPGRRYRIRVELNHVGHAFAPGHRLRVALSTSYWPMMWPAPEPVTLSLFTGASFLELPVRPLRDEALRPFAEPESAPPPRFTELRPARYHRTVTRDLTTLDTEYLSYTDGGHDGDSGLMRIDAIDLELGHSIRKRFHVNEEDPLSAQAEITQRTHLNRRDWRVQVDTRTRLTASKTAFRLQAELHAYEGETEVFEQRWDTEVPREGV